MKEKIKKILRDMELCNGFYDFIIGPNESRLLVNYIKQLNKKNKQLNKENKQLKERINKVLNKIDNMFDRGDANTIIDYLAEIETKANKYDLIQTQQKEFINYLEDLIEHKRLNATCMFEYNDTVLPLKEILQKHKEIIGDAR